MGLFTKGDLVVVSFPFSDLSDSKLRPSLVVGEAENGDYIRCQITSKNYHSDGIEIDPTKDVVESKLRSISYVRPLKLFTANDQIIKGKMGILEKSKLIEAVKQITSAIEA